MALGPYKKIPLQAVAAVMAAWLSGGIFLLCCANTHAMPAATFCPLAQGSHHCDKATQTKNDANFVTAGEPLCFDCCGFIPVLFDKTRKVEPIQKLIEVPALTPTVTIEHRVVVRDVSRSVSYRARLPDNQRTFIRNRVLRI